MSDKARDEAFDKWEESLPDLIGDAYRIVWNAAWAARGARDLEAVEAVKAMPDVAFLGTACNEIKARIESEE